MYDDDIDDEELEDEDDEESVPSNVFVSMAFGRESSDEVWKVIHAVCKEYDLDAQRAHQSQFPGSPAIDDAAASLVGMCDMAIIDLTHERPSVAHEVGLCDGKFDRSLILLIAKEGTPRFANIGSRMVNYYRSPVHLRSILDRQLKMMIDAWHEFDDEDEPGEDEED